MAAVTLILPILFSLCGAAIEPKDKNYTASVGDDVALTWIYDNADRMFSVDWSFKSDTAAMSEPIMTQEAGKDAEVKNSYEVEHKGDGNITLKSVTKDSSGTYYCVVTYDLISSPVLPDVTGTATLAVHAILTTESLTPTMTTNATSTTKLSTTKPTTTTSSSNESTVIIVSSVLGGLFLIGIVITFVLILLSQQRGHHPARNHRHRDQEGRHKRRDNHRYPSWQDHGKYNNASYMEYPGMGTKINPLYTVPYRSAHRAEQSYYLGHPSTDHQNYTKSQQIYYEGHYNNVRPQTDMHSYQQRYYGRRGCNNISSTLHRDENNYVTPDYELYW